VPYYLKFTFAGYPPNALQIRTPSPIRNGLQSESGSASLHRLRSPLARWFQDPGNTTPGLPDYRFFPALSSECSDAPLHQQNHLVAASPAQTLPAGNHSPGLFAHAPCGHTRFAAECSGRRVLLPLCGIAPARRLREDVRFEAIRLAPAGNKMREASYAVANA